MAALSTHGRQKTGRLVALTEPCILIRNSTNSLNQGLGFRVKSKRDVYFQKAQSLVSGDAAYIPICSPHSIDVTSKKLHDFVFSPLEHAYATNKTWLEK